MSVQTTLEAICWAATMTLSHLTSLRETSSISIMETSVWPDVSKHVEKLASCLLDSGEVQLIPKLYLLHQGPPVLPLRQCGTPNGVHCKLGHVWHILPSNTNVTTTWPWNCWKLWHILPHNGQFLYLWNNCSTIQFFRSTQHPTPTTRSGTAPPMVAQNQTNLVSSLSQSLEGKAMQHFIVIYLPSQSWDTWLQGSSVEKGRRWGENMTHVRCAGGYAPHSSGS